MFSIKKAFLLICCLSYHVRAEEGTKNEEEEVLKYTRPSIEETYIAEPFHNKEEFESRWILSEAKKDGVDDSIAKYDGKWDIKEPKDNPMLGDNGLIFTSEAKHGAISSSLKTPFKFEENPLVVQYEVRFQNKHECGGAYIKLLADKPDFDSNEFGDKTEYTIMFGPDKCGGDGKLHFIFQHKNPITHKMEEKHAKKPTGDFNNVFDDGKTHLFGLIVRPDNTFEIQVDKVVVNQGSLLSDMEPAVNPPKVIDDPDDIKPEDWDEREKITDPTATKPEDWDEDAPQMITDPDAKKPDGWLDDEPELSPDPAAVKPEDWDEEEDGEWEAPQIPNPKCKVVGCGEWKPSKIKNPAYKGKWTAPLITNPNYKGIWKPRQIENPNYFEDNNPFTMTPIVAVGFELWSMQSDITFDNIIVADDLRLVNKWTQQTWDLKYAKEAKGNGSDGIWKSFMLATEEKPWLWVIVALVALLPMILIYFLCCTSKEDKAAVYKKTDEVLPDDDSVEGDTTGGTSEDITPESAEEPGVEKSDEEKEGGQRNIEEIVDDVANETEEIETANLGNANEKVDEESKQDSDEVKDSVPKETEQTPADSVISENLEDSSTIENVPSTDNDGSKKISSNLEGENVPSDEVSAEEENGDADVTETSEKIPHASPKTRAAKRRTRKET